MNIIPPKTLNFRRWSADRHSGHGHWLNLGLVVGLAALMIGCASIGVRHPTDATAGLKLPNRILVADFDVSKGVFNVGRSGQELERFKQKTANALTQHLVADLNNAVVATERQNEVSPGRRDAWLLKGELLRVNQGSRALRGLVGLGAGATKIETQIAVYDLSNPSLEPVFQFETSGGSNAEPGAILGGMFGAVPNALRNGAVRGVTDDTARTAREITAMIAEYYIKSGGQPLRSGLKPKMLAER